MNALTVRILNLKPRGRHAADPLAIPAPLYRPFPASPAVTREAVTANLTARRELTAQADQPTAVIPALAVDASWPPAPVRWHPPVSAEECAGRMARITYPPPAAGPERLAAVMCQVSAATGTSTRYEDPAAWKRPALEAGVTAGSWYGSPVQEAAVAVAIGWLHAADEALNGTPEQARTEPEAKAA